MTPYTGKAIRTLFTLVHRFEEKLVEVADEVAKDRRKPVITPDILVEAYQKLRPTKKVEQPHEMTRRA